MVTSAKNPGTKCFGLVTMSSAEEAAVCIERLNKTEFHGRIISLEKVASTLHCCYLIAFEYGKRNIRIIRVMACAINLKFCGFILRVDAHQIHKNP